MASTTCYPWFHATFAPMAAGPQTTISSGCAVGSDGNIPCSPESMRANAEAKMQALGYLPNGLSLATYTLARYLHSEVGDGTVEERVAVGEAAVNRAAMGHTDVNGLLLYRQPAGHPNRGYYGPIHGIGTGVSTAPYGRWAATSRDPTVLSILLADLITSGQSGNFAGAADDQAGPEAWISQGSTALANYVRGLANGGKYWIGPLPGVDHWRTFLTYTPGPIERAAAGPALMQRGIAALSLPAQRLVWPADLPICGKPMSNAGVALLAGLGLLAGALAASYAARRYLHLV